MKNTITKNNQPIKEISQQDIYTMQEILEHFQSWKTMLELMKNFFANESTPINKKKIIKEFHAHSKIFDTFYESYLKDTNKLEIHVENMRNKVKVQRF
ncbi:hypothetical protein [Enterococcus sp. LJL128]